MFSNCNAFIFLTWCPFIIWCLSELMQIIDTVAHKVKIEVLTQVLFKNENVTWTKQSSFAPGLILSHSSPTRRWGEHRMLKANSDPFQIEGQFKCKQISLETENTSFSTLCADICCMWCFVVKHLQEGCLQQYTGACWRVRTAVWFPPQNCLLLSWLYAQ